MSKNRKKKAHIIYNTDKYKIYVGIFPDLPRIIYFISHRGIASH